ncbi:MAG: hypothetical protein AAF653_14290 [Chloroflexota bacterium]
MTADNPEGNVAILFLLSCIVLFIGLVGLIFGLFFGGLRANYRLVTGLWGHILGGIYTALGLPVFVLTGADVLYRYMGRPVPGWLELFYYEGHFAALSVGLVWVVGLLMVGLFSFVVPDADPVSRHRKAGKRKMSDYPD